MVGVIRPVKAAGEGRSTHNACVAAAAARHSRQVQPTFIPLPAWPVQLSAPLCMILPCLPACVVGCVL